MRILIVEDEAVVSLMAQMVVESLGHEVIGPAADIDTALRYAEDSEIDAAILDVNICGDRVYPVADLLIARNIPFVFATGYGLGGLLEAYRGYRMIEKPYDEGMIMGLIDEFAANIARCA